ncbi:MAG: hypothetical protein J7M08_09855 [Planctomycetes bacterium]|nr:hypothetical protein [Planctomycetota bacterium]
MAGESSQEDEFLKEARAGSSNLLVEFWRFLKHNKKWWLIPILVAILLIGLLVAAGGGSLLPFLYTVF